MGYLVASRAMAPDREPAEAKFLGLNYALFDEATALRWIVERGQSEQFSYVVTPNVDHVVRLHRELSQPNGDGLRRAYDDADLRLCDSRILALLARWSGVALPVVAGSNLTARLLSTPVPSGTRIAVVGGNKAQLLWLAAAQPEAVVLHHEPPMGLRSNLAAQAEVADFLEQAKADFILLTVGAPQSEIVAQLVKTRGKARGVALCVGASLEFLTGEKKRAPRVLQRMHLEWAFRLLSEPKRLWRRYLVEGTTIFRIWWRWR